MYAGGVPARAEEVRPMSPAVRESSVAFIRSSYWPDRHSVMSAPDQPIVRKLSRLREAVRGVCDVGIQKRLIRGGLEHRQVEVVNEAGAEVFEFHVGFLGVRGKGDLRN